MEGGVQSWGLLFLALRWRLVMGSLGRTQTHTALSHWCTPEMRTTATKPEREGWGDPSARAMTVASQALSQQQMSREPEPATEPSKPGMVWASALASLHEAEQPVLKGLTASQTRPLISARASTHTSTGGSPASEQEFFTLPSGC